MLTTVRDDKELASAIQSGVNMFCVEGDLANGVIKMKAVGSVAWVIAFGALTVGVAAVIIAGHAAVVTTAVGGPVGGLAGAAVPTFGALPTFGIVAGILGFKTAIVAFGISMASGGVAVLTTLRDKYTIVEESKDRIVLKLKS